MKKIIFLSGSTSSKLKNTYLCKYCTKIAARFSIEIIFVDLKDYSMPIYNADMEENEGQNENAKRLSNLIQNSDAIFISFPEYNGSVTPLLKNAIDWISTCQRYIKKPVVLSSVSYNQNKPNTAVQHLEEIFKSLRSNVLEEKIYVDALDFEDNIKSKKQLIERILKELINHA